MDLAYLKDKLHEELNDAKGYMDKAIESKVTHPRCSKMFVMMADGEVSHATTLMKMMEDYIKENPSQVTANSGNIMENTTNVAPETVYKDCMKAYGETMTYVTNMKRGL